MSQTFNARQPLSLWARFAAFLAFLAVASALLAPVSMLAEEVRTGKLGGICTVNTASFSGQAGSGTGSGDASHAGSHCDLCGSMGLALPPLPVATIPAPASTQLASVALPEPFSGSIPGLPFSRGPPVL